MKTTDEELGKQPLQEHSIENLLHRQNKQAQIKHAVYFVSMCIEPPTVCILMPSISIKKMDGAKTAPVVLNAKKSQTRSTSRNKL